MRYARIALGATIVAAWIQLVPLARADSLDERLRAQEAIERVNFAHAVGATVTFDEAVPRASLEAKIRRQLRRQAAAESLMGRPFTSGELMRERLRIEDSTRDRARLLELFAALGNDPDSIDENLVRPVLVDRVLSERHDGDEPVPMTLTASCGDGWTPTPASGAPSARQGHTMVWTGSRVIVWGGTGFATGAVQTGALYDPALDSWTPMSTTSAPAARSNHSAIWTGTEMIVFGGHTSVNVILASGARYDPIADSWTAIPVAPSARTEHVAIWTGSRMIVWGGRVDFGGELCEPRRTNSGARFDPVGDMWTPMLTSGAPSARTRTTAVWTGSEMLVWGGFSEVSDGGFGTCFGVYKGDGGRFDPVANQWTPLPASPLSSRRDHIAVWTGTEMAVWGGFFSSGVPPTQVGTYFDNGARFNPALGTWSPMASTGAPSARSNATAVWSGGWLVVWGGLGSPAGALGDGGRWNASNNAWFGVTPIGAPPARYRHTAVWTGSKMVVFGGIPETSSGGVYDPGTFEVNDDDGDGWPASCDPCPGDPLNDSDADGACTATDNCPTVANPNQADADGDGGGDVCDDCPLVFNPAQSDVDSDGQGDACDLNDGRIWEWRDDKVSVSWQAEQGFASWNVYIGDLDVLRAAGEYTQDPGSNPLAARYCGENANVVSDPGAPAAGRVAFSLITGVAGGIEGSLGSGTSGPRSNAHPCP